MLTAITFTNNVVVYIRECIELSDELRHVLHNTCERLVSVCRRSGSHVVNRRRSRVLAVVSSDRRGSRRAVCLRLHSPRAERRMAGRQGICFWIYFVSDGVIQSGG